MANHPNRSGTSRSRNPAPGDIHAARQAAGLTQSQAGALIHANLRSWQMWEAGDRAMHPAFWELFLIKTRRTMPPPMNG